MTTNEMILALVATGKFTLPEGLKREDREWWSYRAPHAFGLTLRPQQAHDLCAVHFARENDGGPRVGGKYVAPLALAHLALGDSAAAIAALWEELGSQCQE